MKRIRTAFLLLAALVLCFAAAPGLSGEPEEELTGTVAKVTTAKGPLKMRAKPSDRGRVIASVPNGTCLLLLEEGGDWCRCQWDGKTGYCDASYLTVLREADVHMLDYRVLRKGDKGEDVLAVKRRLQELGYIRSGSVLTGVFNETLAERVRLFQRQIGVAEDGMVSQELQAYLFSDRAPQCTQDLPKVRSQVKTEGNGLKKEICGCCMGEGCECCGFKGWIFY